MKEIDLKDNNGNALIIGDIFSLPVEDFDEDTTWTFKYCVKSSSQFIYLGGGLDFGTAIGKVYTREELDEEMSNSDPLDGGIRLLFRP